MGSAVPAAITNLAAAIQTALGSSPTVHIGMPANLANMDSAVIVMGDVSEWRQNWGVTPYTGTGLDGGRDEDFTLSVVIYRRRLNGSLAELLTDIDTMRQSVETALRNDPTLGGALSASGMAQLDSATLNESLRDDRTREVVLTVAVRCRAWIS